MVKRIAAKSSIYALYVLALAGKPERPLMSFYRSEKSLLTMTRDICWPGPSR